MGLAMTTSDGRGDGPFLFVDPRGSVDVTIDAYTLRLARGDAVIGMLCNGFRGAAELLEGLAAALGAIEPQWSFRHYLKVNQSAESPPELLDQIAGECDAMIGAYGHCGSCTAGTVRDSVAIARRGLPSAALVTEHFVECGDLVARGVGMPDVPRVTLPYPLAQLDAEALASVATSVGQNIVYALRGDQ